MTAQRERRAFRAPWPGRLMPHRWIGILILVVCYSVHGPVAGVRTGDDDSTGSLHAFIKGLWKTALPDSDFHLTTVLFLRFTDFGCVPCLNNVLDVCDTISRAVRVHGNRRVALVFMRDRRERAEQERILRRWASIHHIHFPVFVASATLYSKHFLDYSSLVILGRDGEFIFFEKFPLSAEKLNSVKDILFGKRRQ